MGWWKADPVVEERPTVASTTSPSNPHDTSALPNLPPQHPRTSGSDASACPVDHKTREVWLKQAQAKAVQDAAASRGEASRNTLPPQSSQRQPPSTSHPANSPISLNASAAKECSSDRISQSPITDATASSLPSTAFGRSLSHDREVSTIPRAQPVSSVGGVPMPSNAESETGYDKSSGNWIYPSESQFFNAVMRKQTASDPKMLAQSISSIIPIHNAVNERAWTMIQSWERDSSNACGGPKLLSFQGLGAGALSPRAKMKTWMGYQEPFDRHDWTVERCDGATVEYVIDFYQGKTPEGTRDMENLNFYLDVRPKLNTVEGCRMRFERFVGLK